MKMKAVFMTVCRRSLNCVLLSAQVFAFIARQTRTFARLSLLKYVQHVFIFQTAQRKMYQYSQFI